jgi:hypothetical protein
MWRIGLSIRTEPVDDNPVIDRMQKQWRGGDDYAKI